MIDGYIEELRRELRGPLLARIGMLREVRDGLDDATRTHRAQGATSAEAQRRAVEEFGPAADVAAGLRAELAVASGRRTAIATFVVAAGNFLISDYLWRLEAATAGWPEPTATYSAFAQAVDVFNLVFLVALAAAVLAMGRGGRLVPAEVAVRATALGVLTGIGVDVVAGALLAVFAPVPLGGWEPIQWVGLVAVSMAPAAVLAVMARRTLVLTSGPSWALRAHPGR